MDFPKIIGILSTWSRSRFKYSLLSQNQNLEFYLSKALWHQSLQRIVYVYVVKYIEQYLHLL